VYFLDLGLRNASLGNFSGFETRTDRGALVENFLFWELAQAEGFRLHYWRTTGGAEIYFVLEGGGGSSPSR
jgi:predicted AAA+ superfamily ATPase